MFEITCNDITYNARYFTLDEYEDVLNKITDNNIKDAISGLLIDCIDSYDTNLPKHYAECIFLKLWAHSLGGVTKELNGIFVNFNYIETPKEKGFIYKLDGLSLKMRYPKLFEDSDKLEMVINCIDSVLLEDQTEIKASELSSDDLNVLYSYLTKDVIFSLRDELLRPKPYIAFPVDDEIKTIEGFKNLLEVIDE
ncbi:baseplate hub [Proteus phage phiP4-3]|uniref:Baseplate hub subunit n=1 Tax=Proteus phage phiP4-3 TaxID=2065203 RepID=A0A2I6PFF1_9CAUD|nr:baseplate hub [Proteus phage phiP4-3]AUM58437.1 baseplate hub subunit [Proteus phage phiP4-3]